jgi:hypothetical protein
MNVEITRLIRMPGSTSGSTRQWIDYVKTA